MEKKTVFFRNDDVGLFSDNGVSPELVELTNIFIDASVPISHGVVPAVVNRETINWLLEKKQRFPQLIGIDQHGYRHVQHRSGEFGGNRDYKEQENDIKAGFELMKEYFGDSFSLCFSPPWNKYDSTTKRICDRIGYKVFSGAVSPKLYARVFVKLGQMLNNNVMLGNPVTYHKRDAFTQKGYNVLEISVGVSVVKNYRTKELKTLSDIYGRYQRCERVHNVIGFNLHHWVFDSSEKYHLIGQILNMLGQKAFVSFKLMEETKAL